LELADKPIVKSRLLDLTLLRAPEEVPGPPLRWEDIAREDRWKDEPAIWKTVNYGDTSDDGNDYDVTSASGSDAESTSASTDEATEQLAKRFVVSLDNVDSLETLRKGQQWRCATAEKDAFDRPRKIAFLELDVLRETLFMLQGLKTTLFDESCKPLSSYQMVGISWPAYKAVILSVSELGRRLLPLRKVTERTEEIPLLQVFQESIRQSLQDFDHEVALVHAEFVAVKQDIVVSLPAALEKLRPSLMLLESLAAIIQELETEKYPRVFRYLELLFEATSTAQLSGQLETYKYLGTIFFECFNVYLRPIRLWVEQGELLAGDKTFFVSNSGGHVPLNQIWQHQFKLRRTQDGLLHAPSFLQPTVAKIFTTGKSVVVLKRLGRVDVRVERSGREQELGFDVVCRSDLELAPFTELFRDFFNEWIQNKHHPASATLQHVLFESCGLWTSLNALQRVYLMTDGAAVDTFASPIFGNLDRLHARWNDKFALTEFAQDAFGESLESYRLSASAEYVSGEDVSQARRSVRAGVSRIKIIYRLDWPIQLVFQKESLTEYQALFTLLLQIRRAVHLLASHRLLDDIVREADPDQYGLYHTLRSRLLWFCTTLQTYLTTLVLTPGVAKIRDRLRAAEDVDAMISAYSTHTKGLMQEACLGTKLQPIHSVILDVLDLAIKLEDSRRAEAWRQDEEAREISRLSTASSPVKTRPRGETESRRGVYVNPRDEEEAEASMLDDERDEKPAMNPSETYVDVLQSIRRDFDGHLRFIVGALRGVARASSDAAASKMDMLAEMLGAGLTI
jgi:gamma-tubulin complex component 5